MASPVRAPTCDAFPAGSIRIRTEPLLRIQGYSRPDQVHPQLAAAAERMAKRAETLFQPGIWYRLLQIERIEGNRLMLETGAVLRSEDFADTLLDCTAVVVFILTMGEQFDKEAQALSSNGEVLDLLLFETAGWLGVEEATKRFVAQLKAWAKENECSLTRRFAPGYGAWPLEEQQALFSLFRGMASRVRLLESCAMTPSMSRSGMWGIRSRQSAQ